MKRYLLLFCYFTVSVFLKAQIPQVTGFVSDNLTGEAIQGAIIKDSGSYQYTYTNREGYYNLGLPSGRHTVVVTASGYGKQSYVLDVYNSQSLSVNLVKLDPFENDTNSNLDHTVNDYRSGHTAPLASQVAEMPSLLSEQDPVKFLQYLPGVSGGIEGLSGLYVRGGNADQNLLTMDGLPVYGNGHLFGFLSNFNPDVVRDVQFYRGVMPARYGGRAGSAMDVSTLEGSREDFHGNFSTDPITFKFNFHGPLDRSGNTTMSFGMRRSWLDFFLPKENENSLFYNLHDYNAKLVFRPTENDKISVWFYNGRDKFVLKGTDVSIDSQNRVNTLKIDNRIIWQNTLAGVNYSHRFSPRHYGNFIAGMSRYSYKYPFAISSSLLTDTTEDEFSIDFNQDVSITDFTLKANMEYNISSAYSLRYGAELINHSFKPSLEYVKIVNNGNVRIDSVFGKVNHQQAQEASLYGEWEANLSAGLKMNLGSRLWIYSSRERTYIRPEPRVMLSQMLEGNKAIKLGFSIANQGIHQLSSVNGNLPGDVWFPTSGNFTPQQNIQLTGGFYQPWKKGIEFSMDLYYKWMKGITDLKSDDPNDLRKNYWESMVEQGSGTAYGLELMAMKKTGALNGLVSYTWATSTRTMDEINFGNSFPFRWDRRHKLVMQGIYRISEEFTINFTAVLMTGNAVSVPTGKYVTADGSFVFDYSEKNNFRMPFYKRIDFGFTKEIRPDPMDFNRQFWGINIYNVMNWKNPLFLDITRSTSSVDKAIGISYFPFIPSAFYKFEF